MIKVSSVCLSLDYDEKEIKDKLCKKLKISYNRIEKATLIKRSIDARKKENVHFIATFSVKIIDENNFMKKCKDRNVSIFIPEVLKIDKASSKKARPIVVGFGPAGMFCSLILAKRGLNPIVIERGSDVDTRTQAVNNFWKTGILDKESNVQFGEGGAGTFSDGKLNTGIKSPFISEVLNEFVLNGAPKEILYDAKPHIGTDNLKIVVKNIRKKIIQLGGEIRFNNKVVDLGIKNGAIKSLTILEINNNKQYEISSEDVVLALGHSSRDTFEMIYDKGINIKAKSFSVGARIEHKQRLINKSQFGKFASHTRITPAIYKLATHLDNGRGVYTFCMCPGGVVVPAASEEGHLVTNGMSEYKRDKENANSALLVSVSPDDFPSTHPLAGVEYQRIIEKKAFLLTHNSYKAPVQKVSDFINGRASTNIGDVIPSYLLGYELCDLSYCLPDYIVESMQEGIKIFDKKIKGFNGEDSILTGVETRSSSPIRIIRNDKLCCENVQGLYPCGEGSGYAGGIVSAAVDGIKIGLKI